MNKKLVPHAACSAQFTVKMTFGAVLGMKFLAKRRLKNIPAIFKGSKAHLRSLN
jgi:hypothetical protein